jgi:PH (Pleckstrin Homology) domain-containing protein
VGKGNPYAGMILVGLLFLVGAAILFGAGLIRKNSTEVAVSSKRVLFKTGFIARQSIEVLLLKVESIGVNESFVGRALGYGSVVIRGTGETL